MLGVMLGLQIIQSLIQTNYSERRWYFITLSYESICCITPFVFSLSFNCVVCDGVSSTETVSVRYVVMSSGLTIPTPALVTLLSVYCLLASKINPVTFTHADFVQP